MVSQVQAQILGNSPRNSPAVILDFINGPLSPNKFQEIPKNLQIQTLFSFFIEFQVKYEFYHLFLLVIWIMYHENIFPYENCVSICLTISLAHNIIGY